MPKKKKIVVEEPKVKKPKPKHYVDDRQFYRVMVISLGRGKLEPLAAQYIYKIGINAIRKKQTSYARSEDFQDCLQEGLLDCYSNWSRFNHRKYTSPYNYFTEIFKRGLASGFNKLRQKKAHEKEAPKFVSLDSEFKRSRDGDSKD
jgi:hypothetical protein